jgi:uncharacterized repeat protein (TIGR01451 family)
MKTNQKRKPTKLVALLAGAALFGMVSQNALAAPIGTASGTVVNNLATLAYSVGTIAQTPIGSSATGNTSGAGTPTPFAVDTKINLTVVDNGITTATPGQVGAVHTFTVTNTGNATQDFSLSAANLIAATVVGGNADTIDVSGFTVFFDADSSGTFNAGDTTYIDELPSGSSRIITVIANVPIGAINTDFSNISLTATALAGGTPSTQGGTLTNAATNSANPLVVDVVFADAAGTDDLVLNANHSARGTYDVVTATLTVTKTVTPICDPADGNANPKNIPGAAVRYSITVQNSGAVAASLTSLGDTLDVALLFDPKLNSGALPPTSCVSGNVANTLSANGFAATFGAGVPPGTFVAADAVTGTLGASISGQIVTITYGNLTTANHLVASSTLAVGDYVTVFFNAFVQ